MAARWPAPGLCTEVLAELDATEKSLRASTADDAPPRSFRRLVLDLVHPLRETVSRLERDEDILSPQRSSPDLPPAIEREANSILDSCERTLAAIRHEICDDTLNSTNISPSSRESAALHQLWSFNDRLNIILDLRSLSYTNLLGPDAGAGGQCGSVTPTKSKTEMLVAVAQMRGLFISNKSVPDGPDGPPTYDEAIQGQNSLAAKDKSQSKSSSSKSETAEDNKVDSTHVLHVKPPLPSSQNERPTSTRLQSGEFKAIKLATIQKKSNQSSQPGGVLFTRCFGGKDGGRLALTTSETLELYNTTSGSLLWSLEGSSRQFVHRYGDQITFTGCFQFSPDNSLLCVEITLKHYNRELLILDSQDGRVITRRYLNDNDGTVFRFSPDNTKVAMFKWTYSRDSLNDIKIIPIDVASNEALNSRGHNPHFGSRGYTFNTIPVPQLRPGCWITMSFAPDSKHIITCEGDHSGPRTDAGDTSSSTCIRVYRCTLMGGTLVDEVLVTSSRAATNPLFETYMNLPRRFHYPASKIWLVSFADFPDNVSKTRIVDVTTGETVALVPAERSMWQTWRSGIRHPDMVKMSFDEVSGCWTRMEVTKTLLPPGKTVTITRFELPGSSWRQGSLKGLKDAWSVARSLVTVLTVGADDLCDLSSDGTLLIVRRAATHQVETWSIGGR